MPAPAKTELAVVQGSEEDNVLILLQVHLHSLCNSNRVAIHIEFTIVTNQFSGQIDYLSEVTPDNLVKKFFDLPRTSTIFFCGVVLFEYYTSACFPQEVAFRGFTARDECYVFHNVSPFSVFNKYIKNVPNLYYTLLIVLCQTKIIMEQKISAPYYKLYIYQIFNIKIRNSLVSLGKVVRL